MEAIILNYGTGNVDVIKNIPDNIENLEETIYKYYKDSEVSWILLEDDFRIDYYTYDSGDLVYDNENFINND